jgi:hypothetical protein
MQGERLVTSGSDPYDGPRGVGVPSDNSGAFALHDRPDAALDDAVRRVWKRTAQFIVVVVALSALYYAFVAGQRYFDPNYRWLPFLRRSPQSIAATFELCAEGSAHDACVIDGAHFWYRGAYTWIHGVDAPRRRSPGCANEAALGERSARRLLALLNAGPFESLQIVTRSNYRFNAGDPVRYDLVTLRRNGDYFADAMIDAGLARHSLLYHRRDWCS